MFWGSLFLLSFNLTFYHMIMSSIPGVTRKRVVKKKVVIHFNFYYVSSIKNVGVGRHTVLPGQILKQCILKSLTFLAVAVCRSRHISSLGVGSELHQRPRKPLTTTPWWSFWTLPELLYTLLPTQRSVENRSVSPHAILPRFIPFRD